MHHNGNIVLCEGIDRLCEHAEWITAADEGGGPRICRLQAKLYPEVCFFI